MPRITYIEHNGTVHTCDVADDTNVMQAAVDNGVPGIDGDCGGECACGTCHVYVAPEWAERTGRPGSREQEMLGFADGTRATSRLACQIRLDSALDGLIVHLPEGQH